MIVIITKSMQVIVDADACPVKSEIASAAKSFGVAVVMVASYDHYLQPMDGVTIVQVDRSDQSVDLYIANKLSQGDILVTQDFGLATIGLAKRALVISNRGQIYSDDTIDFLLETRHEHAKQRRVGKYGKGPRPFKAEDRTKFLQTLTNILHCLQENCSI